MGAAFLSSWPWDNLGFFKYVLYGPLVGKALAGRAWEAASPDRWLCLLLALFALRALTYQLWSSYSNMLFLTRRRRIVRDGVDFEQIDKEWDWDNFLILQITMAATALYAFPSLRHLPGWNTGGLAVAAVLHVAATEPLFYAAHRAFHGARLFARYHALHHSNMVPTPFTAGFATPLEHVVLGLLMALPLAGACAAGLGSVGLTFAYVLSSDFLRAMGHCNVELFPGGLFRSLPLLRYLIYTPTYHTIHHTGKKANFCLFMPLFDRLGGTLDASSWELQTKNRAVFPAVRQGRHQRPDRAGHPEGRQDGRQSRQPCSSEQERGAQRRRHAVREQAPEPPGARRPRQHAHGRGHPQRDPQGHHRGLHDRRHLQARQGHRALPLQEEDPRHEMMTLSTERFQKIQKEAAAEDQQYLVQVTKFQSAEQCKTWIVGKWLSPREQRWAPPGTHFHQFVVPPILGFRRDCTYGKLAAMRLPKDARGLGSCEFSLERGVVHACHAGGVVHFLEGYAHHEVGAIDVDRIDVVWEAALKHGIRPV
ncbi:unnamed protein product [Triticum turgidum subsp. durum]|uniref:aldehyde oxygenase (deformylating) n=1 Tax=Triticum turgidum subsp. durum TaxID=4567 RepID=A0A9R0TSS9_TRITD|nr:unnamed protein product [Triticum turgidum subsp. durum]